MPFPNHFNLDAQVRWEAGEATSEVELAPARLKELRTLGHKVERFLAARDACFRNASTSALNQTGWLPDHDPGEVKGEGLFACLVLMDEGGLHLPQTMLAQELTARFGSLWQRCDPAAPQALPPALEVPADANAPLWLALLRLRPLRDLWERELRRATLASLLAWLPAAWMLDPAPLPPGAVIPGLELPAWLDLPRLRREGRCFAITPRQEMARASVLDGSVPEVAWKSAVEKALESFASEPRVLIKLADVAKSDGQLLIAFYERKGGRVEGVGVLALQADGKGGYLPARVSHV